MKLLFIHGSGAAGDIWYFQKKCFADADAPDLPGHPRGKLCKSVDEYVEWLRVYIQDKGYGEVVLAGHSLGGAIALLYALRYPQDLRGIISVGSGARLRVLPVILDAIREKLDDAQGWLNELVIPLYASVDETVRKLMISRMLANGPAAQLNDFMACDKFDIMNKVGEIKLPALAIVGDQDNMTPPKYSQYLASHMPDCRMMLIEGCSHLIFLEKPDRVNRAIEEFLEQIA